MNGSFMAITWALLELVVMADLKVSLPILPNPLIPSLTYDIASLFCFGIKSLILINNNLGFLIKELMHGSILNHSIYWITHSNTYQI